MKMITMIILMMMMMTIMMMITSHQGSDVYVPWVITVVVVVVVAGIHNVPNILSRHTTARATHFTLAIHQQISQIKH